MKSFTGGVIAILLFFNFANAQLKWTGAAGNALWEDELNWENGRLPENGDIIIIDNQYINGDYEVIFPSTNYAIEVESLLIQPKTGSQIVFKITSASLAAPAITCTGSPGIILKEGAVFINNSGASSGEVLSITHGWKIEAGARYVHQTRRAHASLVGALIHDESTRKGVFEFSIPFASNTISMSGRTYGTLKLSAVENADTVIYTAAGIAGATIRGDLMLDPKVNLKMNLSDTLHIHGHLIQRGGLFDLSTTARLLKLKINGNILQEHGEITTTGTIHSEIILSGSEEQILEVKGKLSNRIYLLINNAAGVRNLAPLYLPDSLILLKGIFYAEDDFPIILTQKAWIRFDESNETCFIEGKIKKLNLKPHENLSLPLGERNRLRWIAFQEAEGDMEFGYKASNPRLISENYDNINHVSAMEYWTIVGSAPISGKIIFSFSNGHQSGVTDMEELTTAYLKDGIWYNAGRDSYTGSAGAGGTITSEFLNLAHSPGQTLITLASLSQFQNPLPLKFYGFNWLQQTDNLNLSWFSDLDASETKFKLEIFDMNHHIIKESTIPVAEGNHSYSLNISTGKFPQKYYLKLLLQTADNEEILLMKVFTHAVNRELKITEAKAISGSLKIDLSSSTRENARIIILDQYGKIIRQIPMLLEPGKNSVLVENIYGRIALYYIFAITSKLKSEIYKALIK